MKWVLAMLMAFGLALEARAQANPPQTLAALFKAPPDVAAAQVFGPTPEAWVERSPWNGLRPNYVLGTVDQFQMELFTKPERITPTVCSVTMGWAVFDMGPPPGASEEDKASWAKLGYSERPLRLKSWNRQRQYFAAGPAPATPLEPGGKPVTPGPESLTKDSCANPAASRGRFEAPSDEAAILLVSKVGAVVVAAKRSGPLPFKFRGGCGGQPDRCRSRRVLANLQVGQTNNLKLDEGCADWRGGGLVPGAKRCVWLDLGDPKNPDAYWSYVLMLGKSDRLLEVYVGGVSVLTP